MQDGEDKLIRNLKDNNQNLYILMLKDKYPLNWQNPNKVRNYVKENWNIVDEIEIFDVYSKEE